MNSRLDCTSTRIRYHDPARSEQNILSWNAGSSFEYRAQKVAVPSYIGSYNYV